MYKTLIINDVHRKLSEVVNNARRTAVAEDGRIRVQHAARGLAISGKLSGGYPVRRAKASMTQSLKTMPETK
jgi:hypothetical protein